MWLNWKKLLRKKNWKLEGRSLLKYKHGFDNFYNCTVNIGISS